MGGKKAKRKVDKRAPISEVAKPLEGIKVRKIVDVWIPYLENATEGVVSQEEFSRLSRITINDKPVIERRND